MKPFRILLLFAITTGSFVALYSCKDAVSGKRPVEETMTSGSITLQVDNTIQPIVEDVLAVFQGQYPKVQITQVNRSETDIVNALLNDSAQVAVLTRQLTEEEKAHFDKKHVLTRVTAFATDAVALVCNKSVTDTVIDAEEVYKIMRGEQTASGRQLVFDNPGSSTLRYIMQKAGVDKIPLKNVYSLKNTAEVLTFVKNNQNSIGFIGVNWLFQAPQSMQKDVESVRVMAVDNVKKGQSKKEYFKPSQSNIYEGLYPFTRKLYVLNYQGKKALGMGFATYISAPDGQRIILKSGLSPETLPFREIEISK